MTTDEAPRPAPEIPPGPAPSVDVDQAPTAPQEVEHVREDMNADRYQHAAPSLAETDRTYQQQPQGPPSDALFGASADESRRRELHNRVDRDFITNAPSTPEMIRLYHEVTDHSRALAHWMIDNVPLGRELSLVLTKLDEAKMHANAGIARAGAR